MASEMMDEVEQGVRAFLEMRRELEETRQKLLRITTDHELVSMSLEQTQQRLKTAEAERDHYMRQCTEMMTQITSAMGILHGAQENFDQGLYRPNHRPLPRLEQADDDLTKLRVFAKEDAPSRSKALTGS